VKISEGRAYSYFVLFIFIFLPLRLLASATLLLANVGVGISQVVLDWTSCVVSLFILVSTSLLLAAVLLTAIASSRRLHFADDQASPRTARSLGLRGTTGRKAGAIGKGGGGCSSAHVAGKVGLSVCSSLPSICLLFLRPSSFLSFPLSFFFFPSPPVYVSDLFN
jgi:hypothetical protein